MPSRHPDAIRVFFDSDQYLVRNAIIPIRARLVRELVQADLCGARILDLGCGDGGISRPLLGDAAHLTLVDFSAAMLNRARATMPDGPVEFIEEDVLHYQAAEPSDIVLCIGLLAHVPSPEALVARAATAVCSGGLCVLQITDDGSRLGHLLNRYYTRRHRRRWEMNRISRSDVVSLAVAHNLREVGIRRYGFLLPGVGRLPYAHTRRIEEFAARRPLSRMAPELLLAFRRV